MPNQQPLDIEEQDAITAVVTLMLMRCPAVKNRRITTRVEELITTPNIIGVFPTNGSVYLKKYISGSFTAQQAFNIKYRISPTDDEDKVDAAEILNRVGQWLEGRRVTIDGESYQIEGYPALTEGRTITSIERQSNAFLAALSEDGQADYRINIRVQYSKTV